MAIAGIVAEFNPLHNGHKYLIDCAKSDGHDVAIVLSGNFVQRGDTAIIPKYKRAESALICGADIILELPVPWSMSTAQNFALGALSQLSALNIDILYFGSECGDDFLLNQIAELLLSEDFNIKLKEKGDYARFMVELCNFNEDDLLIDDFNFILKSLIVV